MDSLTSHTLAQHERQRLEECFARGRDLARVEKDYDYAHVMFAECVGQDPANLEYVEALLANLKAKFGGDKKNARHLLRLSGEREFKKAVVDKVWPDVLRLGIEVLKGDPWHVVTLRGMAQACEALHYNEVELAYLKQALDAAPKNVDVNRHCARSLARMGQFDQAIACWHRVEEITGGDREATGMISRLSEEKLKYPGGRPPPKKDQISSGQQPTAESQQPESGQPPTADSQEPTSAFPPSPRQKLEQAIEVDPADVSNYLKLAELLCEMRHYENSERTLVRALDCCAQRQPVENALERVRSLRAEAEREAAEIERQ
jgi:tetratricopeptide (TPR) repeat protein